MLRSNGRRRLRVAGISLLALALGSGCNFLGIEPIELSAAESDSEPRDGGKGGESGVGGVSCDIGYDGAELFIDEARARCYLFFDLELSFSAATAVCSGLRRTEDEERVYLASVGDPEELAFLTVNWRDLESAAEAGEGVVWIGATDAKQEGVWTWRSGEDFDIGPCRLGDATGCWFWGLLEPNDYDLKDVEEDCAELTSSGKVNDKPCEFARSFLCEYDGKRAL